MTQSEKIQTETSTISVGRWENEGGSLLLQVLPLTVDESRHNSDGLLLCGWDGATPVRAFISRRVMDDWVDPSRPMKCRKSLYRDEYNALGKHNLSAIERIVTRKYRRGPTFNRQHPFVDVLLADITESGEVLDMSEMLQAPKSLATTLPQSGNTFSDKAMFKHGARGRF